MKVLDPHRSTALTRVPLFAGLDSAAREDVLARVRSRRCAAGQLICRQGDPSDRVFVLRSGIAQAFVTSITASRATTVAYLRPGDVIGEIGVVSNLPRSASVIARSDAVLLEIAGDDFTRLLGRHPRLLANLTHLLGERLARRNAVLRGGEIVVLVVGAPLARGVLDVVRAARLASPHPVAVVDLQKRRDPTADGADLLDASAPRSITQVIERLDDLSTDHGMVAIVVEEDDDALALLLEQADRVLAFLGRDGATALAPTLRATAKHAELILLADGAETGAPPSDEYRVVRRCATDLTGRDIAWLGRHLSRTKLGLALGAGGAKAFAHAAVVEALERAGYCIDYVAGSSMGAVVAVWLALGMTGAEIATTLREQCGGEDVAASLFRKGAAGDGVEVFTRIFRETTGDRSFDDLSIPVTVMTADLAGRCPAPITTGPLWEALLAALAIPGLYPPRVRDQQRLVDAVTLTPVPLDSVVDAGADITIAVNLLGREALPHWPGDDGGVAAQVGTPRHARDVVVEVIELAQLDASARQTARADVPITPCFGPGTWRHMQLGGLFFAAGCRAAEAQLPLLEKLARPLRALT